MIVTAFNPDTDELEKTYLSTFVPKGAVSLPVKNNDRFISGRKIMIGAMGGEKTEMRTAGAIAADKLAIATDATVFDHNSDDPVYLLQWDKIRWYRRVGVGGTPTLQTTVDVDVDNADEITQWDDTGALSTHYYQYAYYNSVTTEEGPLSDPVPLSGYDPKAIGAIVDGVVRRVRDTGYSVLTMDEYLDVANEVGDDLLTQAQKPYVFLKKSVTLSTVANQNYIDVKALVPDFWKFDYVEIGIVQAGQTRFSEITPLSYEAFSNRYSYSPQSSSDGIYDIAFDDETKRLYIAPTPKTVQAVVKFHYYKTFDRLTSPGSIVETPNSLIYRYKLLAEHYSARSEVDNQWVRLADKYENKYGNEIVKMQRVNRLDVGTPRSFKPPRAYRKRRYYR